MDVTKVETARRSKPVLPLMALALLLAPWGLSCLGRYSASQLDLSRFGPCEDVPEALLRDDYVAKFQMPYFLISVLIDGMAVLALLVAGGYGQLRVLGISVWVLCVLTVAWHLLGLFVTLLF